MAIWHKYCEQAMTDIFKRSPSKSRIIASTLERMRQGYYEDLSIYGQLGSRSLGMTDAYVMSIIKTWLYSGDILLAKIYVGSRPVSDKRIQQNNRQLQHLPSPFSACFWGGQEEFDGVLKWTEPIEVGLVLPTDREKIQSIKPRSVPLEVGYTEFTTTKMHIQRFGAVARWPYEDEWMTLMYLVNKEWLVSSIMERFLFLSEDEINPLQLTFEL